MLTRNHLECLSALTAESLKWGLGFCIFKSSTRHPCAQFRSVALSYPTLCDPMNRSTPGLPVHHQPPEFTQTHIHRVSDTIQPSHPLSSPSPPVPNPSQHQSLFQWVNSSREVVNPCAQASLKPTVYYLLACCVLFSFFHFLLYFSFLFRFLLYWLLLTWVFLFFILFFNEAT